MSVKVGLKEIELWNESMEEEVLAYEREQVKKGQIVFYGPSYFTRWSTRFGMKPMHEVLTGKSGASCVINRGFGSSCAEHQLYYYPRLIRPLAPKVLVYSFYANGPDFGYSAEETWELAQRVIAYAQTDFPGIHIYLCGPGPKRADFSCAEQGDIRRFGSWLKQFAAITPNCFYVDILSYEPMLRKNLYVEDGIHFNQEGYQVYAEIFKTALQKELDNY